jgi:hypothetical protein
MASTQTNNKVLVQTYTEEEKEITVEEWQMMCETGIAAMKWDTENCEFVPNKWWRTFYVKDAYGNVWHEFCERKWIEFCNDGIPMCRSDDRKTWSPNPSWLKNVYWE